MKKILVVDDESSIRKSVRLILSHGTFEVLEAESSEQGLERVRSLQPDLMILDIHLKLDSGIDLIKRLSKEGLSLPTIILSGAATATEAAQAIQLGAFDYVEKPVSSERLKTVIGRCLEWTELNEKVRTLTSNSQSQTDLLGSSAAIEKIRKVIRVLAAKDVKVLITGETGVGKEVIAQSLWALSVRKEKPWLVINSAAVPENLIESELFGHKKGAFTGATNDQLGKIELAHRGTLFLDEIGDLSLNAQTKLLRFLESGEIQKIGSNQTQKTDVRIIAATSKNLEKEVECGHFREDLFYRLNIGRIHIPPLRERLEDVPVLFSFFINLLSHKYSEPPKQIDQESFDLLKSHAWPGNVRELKNIAERIMLHSSSRVRKEDVEAVLNPIAFALNQRNHSKVSEFQTILPLKTYKKKIEQKYIEWVVSQAGGSMPKAAQLLGIDRTYLYQKLNSFKTDDTGDPEQKPH